MKKVLSVRFLFLILVIASMALSACQPAATEAPTQAAAATSTTAPTEAEAAEATSTTAPTEAAETTATTAPTEAAEATATTAPTEAVAEATPTIPPAACAPLATQPTVADGELGSADKPIVITFVPSGDTGKITKAGEEIAVCLNKMTGLNFEIEVGTTFAASIEAMGADKAQVGFLNTFSVLLAREKYQIIPALAVLRKYNTNAVDPDNAMEGELQPFYKGQFIANVDAKIEKFEDLKGKTFCFVDPNSTSGYIIPRIILKANGVDPDVDFAAIQNAGSHPNVAIAVYKGDCDAGVTFIDVLTDAAADLKGKYPDITDKVKAFAVTERIPSDGVQYTKSLTPEVQTAITDALLSMAEDPGGNAVLRGLYTINGFEKIDENFYNDFAAVLQKAGVDPATLIK